MKRVAKNYPYVKRQDPFPFVLEELSSLRPTVKRLFGFTSVYLDDKLLCSLRDNIKQPGSNGMWLYTTTEHVESLGREFPQLPKRQLWRSGKKAWVILASRLEEFEEYAFKACELILNGDQRIGRITRSIRTGRAGVTKGLNKPSHVRTLRLVSIHPGHASRHRLDE
ncbi:MAG TPA: hypothetical protein VF899_04050 [Pyrinomonadaceae bacterium]